MVLEIDCTADAPSFDLCAVLSEMKPNGSVFNFSQGYLRIASPQSEPYKITLQPTCIEIPKGSAIRLSLSGACFPAYPVNPGTGELPGTARAIDAQIITITVNPARSQIRLPLRSRSLEIN
jgi:predicted acyl esterase